MTADDRDDEINPPASPPCFMHELEGDYLGTAGADPLPDVACWREKMRAKLIERRRSIPARLRGRFDARIGELVTESIGCAGGRTIALYWPFRGEPDLREIGQQALEQGACIALPVVIDKGRPLEFRAWSPGEPLARGVWNIPVPAAGARVVVPEIVIAPLVGYDRAGFRLGYGGGYYDRTLAALPGRCRVIGVGYSLARVPSIHPQWHDVPMDTLVTEEGILVPERDA